jgi:hypothetical protein
MVDTVIITIIIIIIISSSSSSSSISTTTTDRLPPTRQGPACIMAALGMAFGWGLLSSVLVAPAYIGMWVTALAVIAALLYVNFKLVKASPTRWWRVCNTK